MKIELMQQQAHNLRGSLISNKKNIPFAEYMDLGE